ncbi:MAG: hypothetical protein ACLRQF_01600 [Thomasclavelia ramosa]
MEVKCKGCTYTALEEVSKTLKSEGIETEIIHVGHKDIRGCIGCRQCRRKGNVYLMIFNDIAPKFKNVMALLLVHQFISHQQMEPSIIYDRLFIV